MTPPRLVPLLAQFDFAREQLANRLVGLSDDEYLWEPVPGCWSIRQRAAGPGPGATLVGAGEWGRDFAYPAPEPPPFTTLAWRLGHLTESMARRADYTVGTHSLTRAMYRHSGDAAGALAAFAAAADHWRLALTSADDAALDTLGRSQYPDGSDPDEPFIEIVWWENQELLHHGAEIALLRDLYRARRL